MSSPRNLLICSRSLGYSLSPLTQNFLTGLLSTLPPQKIYAELLTTNSNMPWSKKQSALLLLIAFLLFEVLIAIYRSYIVYFLLHLCADM